MALNAAGITSAIAALSISGVTVKDVSGMPDKVLQRDCPIMFPAPGDWIGAGSGSSDEETTFGTPSTRYWQTHRTFKYLFLHSAVGTGRGLADEYDAAVTKLEAIWQAVIGLDVAGVDVEGFSHTAIGVLSDPSGSQFNGAFVEIQLREKVNA
jgi:hypothetical protein